MKPVHPDQMNQTGQTFEWQVGGDIKSPEINAYVAPGGKEVFDTALLKT